MMKKVILAGILAAVLLLTACSKVELQFVYEDDQIPTEPVVVTTEPPTEPPTTEPPTTEPPTEASTVANVNTGEEQ